MAPNWGLLVGGLGRGGGADHGEDTPHRVGGLRAYSQPVLCAGNVELDVFVWLSDAVDGGFWDWVVSSNNFNRLRIPGGPISVSPHPTHLSLPPIPASPSHLRMPPHPTTQSQSVPTDPSSPQYYKTDYAAFQSGRAES